MVTQRSPVIVDILEEHFEMLAFLWSQRQDRLQSLSYTRPELAGLEERIEAHVQGLMSVGEPVVPALLEALTTGDSTWAFAAAYTLLRTDRPECARSVVDVFIGSRNGQRDGIGQALCHAPASSVLGSLRDAVESTDPVVGLAALKVLAFQSRSDCRADLLGPFLRHQSPKVRREAWSVAARLEDPLLPTTYRQAVADEDPLVREAALLAAAWARQRWLLDHCRILARSPSVENLPALRLLAVLGDAGDVGTIRHAGWVEAVGASWLEILGSCGHPAVVTDLIRHMESPDPRLASVAGGAFTRITGCDISSRARVTLPPEDGHDPDDFEKEFLDEAFLPDPPKAGELWKKLKITYCQGLRWCRGMDMSREITLNLLDQIDLQSRCEALLRARFDAQWGGGLIDLERFPQRPFDVSARARSDAGPAREAHGLQAPVRGERKVSGIG